MMMFHAFLNGTKQNRRKKNSDMKTYSSCNNTPHLYFMVNLLVDKMYEYLLTMSMEEYKEEEKKKAKKTRKINHWGNRFLCGDLCQFSRKLFAVQHFYFSIFPSFNGWCGMEFHK